MTQTLRSGRTTGTCATAAAMAGVLFLLNGERVREIKAPLPPGGELLVPVERIESEGDTVRVTVIKDGGDDPDATHGCEIQAVVTMDTDLPGPLEVTIDGGIGVGRVTLPGLPVAVGKAAINPEPLKQIEMGVRLVATTDSGRIHVLIEVPEGETIARRTMNARLGILGGISILGTQGIVKPYSHASWKATIDQGLSVARAQSIDHVIFSTGRRSERFYQLTHPQVPEQACVQAADFFAFSMQAAVNHGFTRVTWTIFFGKLVKQAQGMDYTHAKSDPIDFDQLALWCAEAGINDNYLPAVHGANTANQVLALLENDPARPKLIELLVGHATNAACGFANNKLAVDYAVFDLEGVRLR